MKSGCAICPNFCGIDATVVNGIVRTIYPDAARADFYNHGICPKGASGMFNTYDPYRLKKPLKRTNPKKGRDEDPKLGRDLVERGVHRDHAASREDPAPTIRPSWSGSTARAST